METLTIASTVRTYPRLPYQKIKNDILGSDYQLSLVFVGTARARALNERCRGKTYVPNVLAFPLSENAGEIYITPSRAAAEAPARGLTPRGCVGYLYIHALLHLKGHEHGATMEKAEKRYFSKYTLA